VIFVIFKMAFQDGGRRHLGFSKIRNFNVGFAVRCHYAPSCQISSKWIKWLQRYGDLTVFFRMAVVRHLGFVGRILGSPTMTSGGLCHCAKFGSNRCSRFDDKKLSIFCRFGLKMPIHAFKIVGLGGFYPQNGEQYQRNPQKASPRRSSHQA